MGLLLGRRYPVKLSDRVEYLDDAVGDGIPGRRQIPARVADRGVGLEVSAYRSRERDVE